MPVIASLIKIVLGFFVGVSVNIVIVSLEPGRSPFLAWVGLGTWSLSLNISS